VLANPDTSLLISGFGDDTGGGLFCFDGDQLEQLDDLSTTGLNTFDGHLARLLRTGTDEEAPGELLIYDMHGLLQGWMRGLAVGDDLLFVGESSNRRAVTELQGATVALVSRADWRLVGRIAFSSTASARGRAQTHFGSSSVNSACTRTLLQTATAGCGRANRSLPRIAEQR
jgi:hypothetical protein